MINLCKKFPGRLGGRVALLASLVAIPALVRAQSPPPLFTPAPSFVATTRYVATSVFQWFTATGGQLTGPWRPVEGRNNWTGTPGFWKGQVKQMMVANIDVLYVHLIPSSEAERTNLFIALNQLRAEGYDTPKIAPFLDPMITWDQKPLVNLATPAGKDEFVGQYLRFYNQYFGASTGAFADDYLARQANKPILDTWHVKFNVTNLNSLTRADVSNRLAAAFGASHPYFTNGFVMVTTALNDPTLSFADEKVPQFEISEYYRRVDYIGTGSVQLKGGYWDQNIRNPGAFLPRAGGVHYSNAWNQVNRAFVRRVYLESWNEYDEGSGLYAVTNLPPYIKPGSGNINTDVWSASGDPFEYIKTTARGAANFNDTPWQASKLLWHNIPTNLAPNETRTVSVVIRNTGDASWTCFEGYKFLQKDTDQASFSTNQCLINDAQDEIPLYGGIFRGRPKTFTFIIRAPKTPGVFTTHWSMMQENVGWFGEELSVTIKVGAPTQLQPPVLNPAGAALRWNATNGVNYTVEFTDNLSAWTVLSGASNLPGPLLAPFELSATNSEPLPAQRQYRIRLTSP
ncbi:MAG: NBR1-Ig-like domain-containing protein [Verrucomicrobiota bacterium]